MDTPPESRQNALKGLLQYKQSLHLFTSRGGWRTNTHKHYAHTQHIRPDAEVVKCARYFFFPLVIRCLIVNCTRQIEFHLNLMQNNSTRSHVPLQEMLHSAVILK